MKTGMETMKEYLKELRELLAVRDRAPSKKSENSDGASIIPIRDIIEKGTYTATTNHTCGTKTKRNSERIEKGSRC